MTTAREAAADDARKDLPGERRGASSAATLACSACAAASLATTLRLPREALASSAGSAPAAFLLAYTALAAALALPAVFVEMALGRLGEQGAVRLYDRAVPLLKGLGYIKLFSSFLVAVYYMIYLGIISAMLIWTAKGPLPLVECRELHRAVDGYRVFGIPGQRCLNETFLKPVVDDPMWYGIVAAIIFTMWLLASLCLISVPQTYLLSLYVFGGGVLALSVALTSMLDLANAAAFFGNVRWELFASTELWDAATVQLVLSTQLGFGYHITMGGTIYKKRNILRSATWFVLFNVIYSWFSVFLWFSMAKVKFSRNASLLMTLVLIYDSSLMKDMSTSASFSYALLIFSGLISVLSLMYPIVWCISLEDFYHKRSVVWLISVTGIFCSLSIFILGIDVMTVLDVYVMPIYFMTFLSLTLYGFIFIYGLKSLAQDLNFVLNQKMASAPLWLCAPIPVYLTLVVARTLCKNLHAWPHKYWTYWVLVAMLCFAGGVLLLWALWVVAHKEGYGVWQKLLAAAKPSRKWGPEDFKLRYNWLQYKTAKRKFWKNGGGGGGAAAKIESTLQRNNNAACVDRMPIGNGNTIKNQRIVWVADCGGSPIQQQQQQMQLYHHRRHHHHQQQQFALNRSYAVAAGHVNEAFCEVVAGVVGHVCSHKEQQQQQEEVV